MPTDPERPRDAPDGVGPAELFEPPSGGDPAGDDRAVTEARIRDALRLDAATAPYADRVRIFFIGSRAVIRGEVDGARDGAAVVAVVASVAGVPEVIDETTLRDG